MLSTEAGRPVHIPANPDVFQFDEEVSRIFPDMASRAIPMYHEAHRAHVAMLEEFLSRGLRSVLDIGASRGAFFMHLLDCPGLRNRVEDRLLSLTAVEYSPYMADHLRRDFPQSMVYQDDLSDAASPSKWRDFLYDVVVCNYVLQFIPYERQMRALQKVIASVRPGGFLIFGHKEALPSGDGSALAHDEYIRFRLRNGYTQAEIDAKTKALKGSMFTMSNVTLRSILEDRGFIVTETTRWMHFNTLIAQKQ